MLTLLTQHKCRVERAGRRHGKVVKLHFRKPRVHVWKGAVLPWAQYGMLAQGISHTARRRLRGQLVTHLGWQAGMCATTLIDLEMPGKDPTKCLPTRAVFEYIQLWLSLDNDLRVRIANA